MGMTITGPVTGGKHGWPYGATLADLAGHGYVEEEWFFEGDATRYRPTGPLGVDGRWSVEAAGTSPFKTRAVVRRPVDPARFNGTVLVEWNNVSAGSDIFEVGDTPVVFDEGFAYVGVSAQRVGVHGFPADPHGLRAWDPERYESLDIPDDAMSYGIFTAVAKAVGPDRDRSGVDPLGGLVVERMLGVGGSQSAGRLVSYLDAVQPIERVFDGFVPFTWFGSGTSIDDGAVLDLSVGGLGGLQMLPTRVREDLDVPVIVVNSECETLSCVAVRQPDTDRFRFWEVAGAPHGPRLHMERIVPKQERDGLGAPGGGAFDASALSPVPWAPVLDAAIVHLDRWVRDGTPPPSQPLVEVEGEPARIRRDERGNALGGVRVPEMEAPLARHTAAREEAGAGGLMGLWEPFSPEQVRALYPDRAAYLSAYEAAARAAVEAGVIRPRDAEAGIERSKAETLP